MVRLNCESAAERLMIPAFVFFFALLYPFRWVADPKRATAAAAGGCILVRRAALERIGYFASISDRLIDDCALAAAVKKSGGRIWLGLSRDTVSLRPYRRLSDVWRMVARTAYTQLRYSPLLLAGTVIGLRSEEHTSELQSRENLVCRLLLEKKKQKMTTHGPAPKTT